MNSLSTKTMESMKILLRESSNFKEYFDKFDRATSTSSCDKYEAGFTVDDNRFRVFSAKVSFDAYTGHYGNSGCETFGKASNGLIEKYLPKALDGLKREIFAEMSRLMLADAKSMREEAEKELANLRELLNSVGCDTDSAERASATKALDIRKEAV